MSFIIFEIKLIHCLLKHCDRYVLLCHNQDEGDIHQTSTLIIYGQMGSKAYNNIPKIIKNK